MTAHMAQFVIPAAPALVVFWTAAFLLFYVYAGYPLLAGADWIVRAQQTSGSGLLSATLGADCRV